MYNSKLARVAYGVTLAEGWEPRGSGATPETGSASYQNHNPGNLRVSEFECGNTGEFSVFINDNIGMAALERQLEMIASGKDALYGDNDTIEQAFQKYTADRVGSTELDNYLSTIERVGGVNRTDLVSTIV